MRRIVHTIARKTHHAGYLAAKTWRSFWVSATMGKCGKNLKVLGAPKILFPANIVIGDNCTLNHGVVIDARAKVTIGSNVRISSYSLIETAYLDKDADKLRRHDSKEIVIGDNVWIASGAKILAGVTIGQNAIIAAGAVVTKDIPANSLAKGVPATVSPLNQGAEKSCMPPV